MIELFIGTFLIFIAFFIATWSIYAIRYLLNLNRIDKIVRKMEPGLFVQHGMVFDKDSGMPRPQSKPTAEAFRRL
ncbi:hypothetical protein [Marichromatium purpuratum]|uniref:hypothetical protein n=1 Tax=Marichromatium purpuratum TaxID=37487 RepID=UPI0012EB2E5C|nr:hypothetical protein [Marichromatium purpuratum]